jgi:glycosyltransferase involved in cell wall biosynthesis
VPAASAEECAVPRILVMPFAFNEGEKIRTTLSRFPARRAYDLMVMDDGSTDGSLDDAAETFGVAVLRHERNRGVGAAMKTAFTYALDNGYDVFVAVAGNNKDDPTEIDRLLEPILNGGQDFVQGSRFLPGGRYGEMPTYRILATKIIHPLLLSVATGKRITESTNGFRAFRLVLLRDQRIAWRQKWLDAYELEPYMLYKAIKLGYRHTEVPVTKIYPPRRLGYSKIKPLTGWWSMLRPVVYLALGFKN